MSPEYAFGGIFSIKSDVFSFGVLLLEIVSGKKNTGFYRTDYLNLLGYAWDLWTSNRTLELIDDPVLEDEYSSKHMLAPRSRYATTTPVRSRSVTTTLVRSRTVTNDLPGYDSGSICT
ncbi:hypothetical protein WN944_022567 [Citrus x changshan-huyou]|uniref:Serine-threonine/tyrosine-protein kinase catalytic domain-containing protein n=1 Tax=Citrus x changshan-huyou TaxID=2935761 RepID=A0AAP0R0H1_9ROSI